MIQVINDNKKYKLSRECKHKNLQVSMFKSGFMRCKKCGNTWSDPKRVLDFLMNNSNLLINKKDVWQTPHRRNLIYVYNPHISRGHHRISDIWHYYLDNETSFFMKPFILFLVEFAVLISLSIASTYILLWVLPTLFIWILTLAEKRVSWSDYLKNINAK